MLKAVTPRRGLSNLGSLALPVLVAAGLLAGSGVARAALVWNQPTDYNEGWASQFDNGASNLGAFATSYDNFNLSQATAITSVSWVGCYSNPQVPGTISSFELQFWSDAAGQPGSSLMDYVIPGSASETFLQNDNIGDPTYAYSVDLASEFDASAGTQYWLSVVATSSYPPQWYWETGTGGDGNSVQDFDGFRNMHTQNDLAYTLSGHGIGTSPVPEPRSSSLVMLGLVASGLMVARSRRA